MRDATQTHPADLYGRGRRTVIEAYRCTQPVASLERQRHPGRRDHLVEHALFMRRHYEAEVQHFDAAVANPRLGIDVFCYNCHGFRGEHRPTCLYSPRGRAFIAWLRHRLGLTAGSTRGAGRGEGDEGGI